MSGRRDPHGIGKSSRYEYPHATKHLKRWVKWYDSGSLVDVYQISREAHLIWRDRGHETLGRKAINNTIAMAVTKKFLARKGIKSGNDLIPQVSTDLFRAYNAGIRRLAVFEASEIEQAADAGHQIGWRIMATLAKITAPTDRSRLLERVVAGDLSHIRLQTRIKQMKPNLSREVIPGNVLKVTRRSLEVAVEQLKLITDPAFAERLDYIINREEFQVSLEAASSLLHELRLLQDQASVQVRKLQKRWK